MIPVYNNVCDCLSKNYIYNSREHLTLLSQPLRVPHIAETFSDKVMLIQPNVFCGLDLQTGLMNWTGHLLESCS